MIPLIFACTVLSVYDGDTFTCADQTRIRLAAVDAPELHGCRGRRGRICVPGSGAASKRALSRMIAGRVVRCERTGTSYNRTVAFCSAPGIGDLSCAMMRQKFAAYVPKYDRAGRLKQCK